MNTRKQYHTRQREELLSCMAAMGNEHFTAMDMATKMKAMGSTVGLTTVYRHLDKLVEEGIVRRFFVDAASAACYQLRAVGQEGEECRRHYHLKCERCARLFHVQCAEIDGFTAHMNESHGFVIDHARTVFYGICADCAQKQA